MWGPFLLDVNDPGRIDTWACLEGKLILGAMVRLTPRDWVYVCSYKTQGDLRHNLKCLTFGRELTGAGTGRCWIRYRGSDPQPVLRSDRPGLDFASGSEMGYVAACEEGPKPGRVIVTLQGASFIPGLHLDLEAGLGSLETQEAVVYEASPRHEVK